MNLADIRAAISARLDGVSGVRSFAYPPDSIPAGIATVAVVKPAGTYCDYQEAFAGGLAMVHLTVELWVAAADVRSAMDRLDAVCSSGSLESQSIIDSLMGSDRTLGGVCSDLVVDDVSGVRVEIASDGARYVLAELGVRVLVGRT